MWLSSASNLDRSDDRPQLVTENEGEDGGFRGDEIEEYSSFEAREDVPQDQGLERLWPTPSGERLQWVVNDDGTTNFLQRPPSRQREAFPTHLADMGPYTAFQVSR